jgi:hypothetical protein
MDMPFANVSDLTFLDLFTPDVEAGVWEIVNGEWTFGQWWYLSSVGWRFEPHAGQDQDDQADQADQDQDDQADQDQNDDPLDYPDYDYEDPRDLD